ncbi:MAG: M14 family zinc carboxypeptidase [Anaerolineaceae bacterium]|nr:M14 family zinc carboxypeptidase [Anaerolineaceae bacterium]
MNLKEIAANIPHYEYFLTVDEMRASTAQLHAEFPDITRVRVVGTTREDDPLELLSIHHQDGLPNAFLFGAPHPNEPIGCMAIEFLSRLLCEDESLRDELGFNWHFIKCIDADGTRLNEGWFRGPFHLRNYHRDFYRPRMPEQVEWTFPIDYKTLHFDQPLPETRALMRCIDELQPRFLYSLHNAEFGGVYYYISEGAEDIFPLYQELPSWFDLQLELGEPEMPYAVEFAPAIYKLPTVQDAYDFLEEQSDADPASLMQQGSSSFGYAEKYGTKALIVEMPYWDDPRVSDLSASHVTRREAIREGAERSFATSEWLQNQWETAAPHLKLDTPLHRAAQDSSITARRWAQGRLYWVENSSVADEAATVAELFSNQVSLASFEQRGRAMWLRALEAEINAGNQHEVILKARDAAEAEFEGRASALEAATDYRILPIRSLVGVQVCAGLAAAHHWR